MISSWESGGGSGLKRNKNSSSSHFWEQKTNPYCFHLERICHGNGTWFYDSSGTGAFAWTQHQPTILYDNSWVPDINLPDKVIYFNVSSTSRNKGNAKQCQYSPTPYHVVLQSLYNDMLGEFYLKTLRGLHEWMRLYPPRSNDDIKLYVHFAHTGNKGYGGNLYHGHHLFLGSLPHNNQGESFLQLVNGETCQCLKKLVFCGYKVKSYNQTTTDSNQTYEKSFQGVGSIEHENTTSPCDGQGMLNGTTCTAYNNLRHDLLSRYKKKDPMLANKVRDYRQQTLLQNGFTSDDVGNVDDWKIVGLTDRKFRRVWLNIDDAVKSCREFVPQKVLCTKVDVEAADSLETQLLMHMSLDVFVGVHGSQFTNAVLLPDKSFILELLPWQPKLWDFFQKWTKWTSRPTPMGEIFHNTQLNHLGYRLGKESLPLCEHLSLETEEEIQACLSHLRNTGKEEAKLYFSHRDFNVNPGIITKFISTFLLQNNTQCEHMHTRAQQTGFVIYNAYCYNDTDQGGYRAAHYFEKDDE